MKFCLTGTGRCGTKLLRGMLNDHPDLFVFNETHWIAPLYETYGTGPAPLTAMLDIVARTHHVNGAPVTELDAADFQAKAALPETLSVQAFVEALGAYFASAEGKTIWADKTPDYGYMLGALQLYWPGCKVIHLIRDGAAVARSMAGHPGYRALAALRRPFWAPLALNFQPPEAPWPAGDIPDYAHLWHTRLSRIRNEATRLAPGSYLELRHEDVLADPGAVLAEIADFIGLRHDAAWLERARGQINTATAAKPRPVEVLEAFTPAQIALMRDLGYDTGASA